MITVSLGWAFSASCVLLSPADMEAWQEEHDRAREIEMIAIDAGSFFMGSTDGASDESPVHAVTLTRDFWLGGSEVTQAQWEAVMGAWDFHNDGCAGCPAESMSWYEVALFANALSDEEGLDRCYTADGTDTDDGNPYDCEGYRLPTEAEWEYAARAGEDFTYAGSDDADEVAWTSENADESQRVCTKDANAWGLCDMSGNVWEWTNDWYAEDYYAASPEGDPPGASAGPGRVVRGGSWDDTPAGARVANRGWHTPADRRSYLGLRLARACP
jgi:formylglycine-generating enzyme required for sulfatase activity